MLKWKKVQFTRLKGKETILRMTCMVDPIFACIFKAIENVKRYNR